MINEIGWIGNFFFVLGAMLLARKNIFGWHCQFLGNLAYVVVGFAVNKNSLWALSILLILINLYGLFEWQKNGEKQWIDIKN